MEQYNDKEGIEESMEIARLRFGMIAPVIQETYPDESIMLTAGEFPRFQCSSRMDVQSAINQKQLGNGFRCTGTEELMH